MVVNILCSFVDMFIYIYVYIYRTSHVSSLDRRMQHVSNVRLLYGSSLWYVHEKKWTCFMFEIYSRREMGMFHVWKMPTKRNGHVSCCKDANCIISIFNFQFVEFGSALRSNINETVFNFFWSYLDPNPSKQDA